MSNRFLTFVYVGQSLPSYARRSLELAAVHSGLGVRIISNARANFQKKTSLIDVVTIEDFYDESLIEEAASFMTLDREFRDGFWIKTLERFFVLEQFMRLSGERNLLHAELDQLLFRADKLLDSLEARTHEVLAFPIHGPEKAVASIFFASNPNALGSLVDFATSGEFFSSEMALLWHWALRFEDTFLRLPTISDVLRPLPSTQDGLPRSVDSAELGGVVDAAELGLWVGGRDPRNLPLKERPTNHFTYPQKKAAVPREILGEIRLELDFESSELKAESPHFDEAVALFNLHIHSKTHAWVAKSAKNLVSLIDMGNLGKPSSIPGTRASQLSGALTGRLGNWHEFPLALLRRGLLICGSPTLHSTFIVAPESLKIIADYSWSIEMTKIQSGIPPGSSILVDATALRSCLQFLATSGFGQISLVIPGSIHNDDLDELDKFLRESASVAMIEDVSAVESGLAVPLPKGVQSLKYGVAPLSVILRRMFDRPQPRLLRISWGFEFELNFNSRSRWAKALAGSALADRTCGYTVHQRHRAYSLYGFSACPPGPSPDTHELWESIYLGCVPIVEESEHAKRLIDLGLPIWMISDLSELKEINGDALSAKFAELRPLFSCEFLGWEAWRELLKSSPAGAGSIGENN